MWVAVSVVLMLSCLVIFWALRPWRLPRTVPTQLPVVSTLAPLQTPQNVIDLTQARQAVDKNPGDPDAHLQLALAYHQAEMPEMEQDSISQVIQLVAEDEGYLWESARLAAGKSAWLSAARLALEGTALHLRTNPSLPADLGTLLHESMYKTMKISLTTEYIQYEQVAQFDEPLARVAEARYILYAGDQVVAQEKLDALFEIKPGFAEAELLQAEISMRVGDLDRARQTLKDLRANPGVQGWMLQEANVIERNLP
jgi:hypothetical protein